MVFKRKKLRRTERIAFENDVKMYGIQTLEYLDYERTLFENDVKMYGIQTK